MLNYGTNSKSLKLWRKREEKIESFADKSQTKTIKKKKKKKKEDLDCSNDCLRARIFDFSAESLGKKFGALEETKRTQMGKQGKTLKLRY